MGLEDAVFDHRAFHRYESGEIKPRHVRSSPEKNGDDKEDRRSMGMKRDTMMGKSMMKVTSR